MTHNIQVVAEQTGKSTVLNSTWLPECTVYRALESFFSRATFASQIVCLCLEPLKNYKALKFTMVKNTQKNTYFSLQRTSLGLPSHAVIFRKLPRADVKP